MNQITIKNNFISLTVLDYGAIVQRILVKDKSGRIQNVVVGFDDPMAYLNDTVFLGACVGRYAGRIKGRLLLDDRTYPLHTQNGVHLHGGQEGFGKKYWSITAENHGTEPFVKLSYLSPDMEEGYPGNLQATALYQLIGQELHITHEAVTDRTTVVNLTNHSYFQLDQTDSLKDHQLFVNCSERLETHDDLVPTGNRVPVQNSAYDFLSFRSLSGVRLDTPYVIDDHTKEVATMYSL
ncbi:MAG: galactose mutarotase, partial [Bacteroidota bacterium]